MEGAEGLHLFYCSTSGARDWHGVPASLSLPWHRHVLTIQPCVCLHPAVPWKPPKPTLGKVLLGVKATSQPGCAAGMRPQQSPGTGGSGLDRSDTARQGMWGPGCPWGQAEPGRGAWGLPGGADLVFPAWCSGHVCGAQCPLPSTWCWGFTGSHRPVECSVPLPVPTCCPEPGKSWCQCPEHSAQCTAHRAGACGWCWWLCWCQCPVLAVVTVHGGTACCVLCPMHCALCGAGASARAGIHCWCPVPGTSGWCWFGASVLVALPGAQSLCPVPTSRCPLPLSSAKCPCPVVVPVPPAQCPCPLPSAHCPVPCGPCLVPVSRGCSAGAGAGRVWVPGGVCGVWSVLAAVSRGRSVCLCVAGGRSVCLSVSRGGAARGGPSRRKRSRGRAAPQRPEPRAR